ncbi:MAG: hypothetical protein JKY92_08175 [Magnetovibrio sp.]|nr:hypothetical protein [Magnetovibrio sp.]
MDTLKAENPDQKQFCNDWKTDATARIKAKNVGLEISQDKTILESIGSMIPTETKTDVMELEGKLTGKGQAAAALNHYKNGDGEDYQVPTEFLINQQEIKDAEIINQDAIGKKIFTNKSKYDQLSSIKYGESTKL